MVPHVNLPHILVVVAQTHGICVPFTEGRQLEFSNGAIIPPPPPKKKVYIIWRERYHMYAIIFVCTGRTMVRRMEDISRGEVKSLQMNLAAAHDGW